AGQFDQGGPHRDGGPGGGGHREGPAPLVPLATYAELRDAEGTVLATVSNSTETPRLPAELVATSTPRFLTTGSTTGSERWRTLVTTSGASTVVIAVPTGEVTNSLHRLTLIEISGGAVLLAILCAGSWVILRRGLRPLEEMASTAGEIAAGDLSQRVAPAENVSEVGRLGLALNTMLDEIEEACAERDATEQRL